MPPFTRNTDWRSTSLAPLPDWIGISRLTKDRDALYYHSAVIICAGLSAQLDEAEAIIYTPHGVEAQTFTNLATADPGENSGFPSWPS